MNPLSPQLSRAIASLYKAFHPYCSRPHPDGCPCCVSDKDQKTLFSKPLHELTAKDLDRFAWKVLATWGEARDLKHFLPRVLELIATDDCAAFELEAFFGKLRVANWADWPKHEREAVDHYFQALWEACLSSADGSAWVDELLCALGRAINDLTPFLKTWENCRATNGYAHLHAFLDWNAGALLKKRRLSNAFWSDAEEQMDQVIRWLMSVETEDNLQIIFDMNGNTPFADDLARVIDQIGAIRHSFAANS